MSGELDRGEGMLPERVVAAEVKAARDGLDGGCTSIIVVLGFGIVLLVIAPEVHGRIESDRSFQSNGEGLGSPERATGSLADAARDLEWVGGEFARDLEGDGGGGGSAEGG